MPFILNSLSEKLSFAPTVRIVRILYILLRRHITILIAESEMALGLLIHMLDPDAAAPWKRALCMEVFRGIFAETDLVRKIFGQYDAQEGKKPVIRDLAAAFVRLSTEKPSIIGLGQQSTIPVGQDSENDILGEQAVLEASGVAGVIGVGSNDSSVSGISTQWSSIRVPCIDQLDKNDPPPIPDSYIYSLTLTCINTFSEGLARFILPLTVPTDIRGKKRAKRMSDTPEELLDPSRWESINFNRYESPRLGHCQDCRIMLTCKKSSCHSATTYVI